MSSYISRSLTRPPCQNLMDAPLAFRFGTGSPACAGIDLYESTYTAPVDRLPRVRGDRPNTYRTPVDCMWAPPRARGSTSNPTVELPFEFGSPACAGIDPRPRSFLSSPPRLPRVRGDRPRVHRIPARFCPGSPACAGIDPCSTSARFAGTRLPRVRGDRPSLSKGISDPSTAPPRARGSTRMRGKECARQKGSPACAGIDPGRANTRILSVWLPRVRGDRPRRGPRLKGRGRAPPRARGSTPIGKGPEENSGGSPACAGIDLLIQPWRRRRMGLPRVRGDRPL